MMTLPDELPTYFPRSTRDRYKLALSVLLKTYTMEQLAELVTGSRSDFMRFIAANGLTAGKQPNEIVYSPGSIPPALAPYIKNLSDILREADDVSEFGLETFLGQEAVRQWRSNQQRSTATKERGARPFTRAVRRVLKETPDRTFDQVIRKLKDDEFMNNLLHSSKDPIGIQAIEVDEDEGTVIYSLPAPASSTKIVKFSSIRNLVSKINKKKL